MLSDSANRQVTPARLGLPVATHSPATPCRVPGDRRGQNMLVLSHQMLDQELSVQSDGFILRLQSLA